MDIKNQTLSKKLFNHTLLLLFFGVIIISSLWFFHIVKDYKDEIEDLKINHVNEQKKVVENSVKFLIKLTEEREFSTKEDAVKFISKLRYGKNGYFWINDFTPTMIMHPIVTSLDGKYLGNYQDPNGKFLFNAMVKVCKEKGEGFVQYHWLKPDDKIVRDKISFVKVINKYNWIIGSGIYLDDIEKAIEIKKNELNENIIIFVIVSILLSVFLSISLYILVNKFYKEIKESFEQFNKFTKNSFKTSIVLDTKQFKYLEFKQLAKSTNTMIKQRLKFEKKIVDFSDNLEDKVEQRTKELKQNYKKLQSTQAQLIQSEKMASLGALVAGVSHEVNTPLGIALTAITHSIEELKILEENYNNKTMSEKDFIAYINEANQINDSIYKNLSRAVSLIKSFKQVAVDQSSEELREFRLKDYIEEILISLHNRIKKTKLKINVDIDDNITINSYPGAFSQIFTNLIMNSIIHGYKDDEKGNINITANLKDKKLIITYEDDGKGLDDTIKQKIFDPFYTTNRAKGGSGLGMNIVYNLVVKKLHGTIEVKDKDSKGVLFVIKLII